MTSALRITSIGATLVLLVWLAGCKEGRQSSSRGGKSPLVGKTAPAFQLDALDGKVTSLPELEGSVVVLDFWATWCGPCVTSLPDLAKLRREMEGQDVHFFAVNVEEPRTRIDAFLKQVKLDVPILLDTHGEAARAYRVEVIPNSVVIGRDGIVEEVILGVPPAGKLKQAIERALGKSAAQSG